MDPNGRALTRAEVLKALHVAFSDPDVLVGALRDADSDEEAVERLCQTLGLTPAEADIVLDQQIRHLTRGRVNALASELPSDGSGRPSS
jgi:DNA gyrase/topoisomerase IV subunit A